MIKIDPVKRYAPKTIIANKWVVNNLGKSDYDYILKLIRLGHLKATDVSLSVKGAKRYMVRGVDIIQLRRTFGYE